MSLPLLIGVGALGAAALVMIEKKRATDSAAQVNAEPGYGTNAGPMSYPDSTDTDKEGNTIDTNLGDLSTVGTEGPIDESETPASGTGPRATTHGATGLLGGPGSAPPPPITTYHRIVPLVEYAYGTGTVLGKNATAQAYATTGPKIGAIW